MGYRNGSWISSITGVCTINASAVLGQFTNHQDPSRNLSRFQNTPFPNGHLVTQTACYCRCVLHRLRRWLLSRLDGRWRRGRGRTARGTAHEPRLRGDSTNAIAGDFKLWLSYWCVLNVRNGWVAGGFWDDDITTGWCPPSYKLVYNPINYRYIYHKSKLLEL